MSQLYGVDVSEFQGEINWDTLNSVANFVVIRASFGTMRTDNQFARNQSEARRVQESAGPLGIGYYYFAYPTLVDPVTSANYFVSNLGVLQKGELLALDLEGNVGSAPVAWALSFLERVETLTGVKPLIYLNQSLVNSYDWSPVINNGNGLWLADYDGNKTGPGVTTPWSVTALRQWTDADIVAGITGPVDGDVFYGDFNAWDAYGYHAAPATSTAPISQPVPENPVAPPTVPPDPVAPVAPLPPVVSDNPPETLPTSNQTNKGQSMNTSTVSKAIAGGVVSAVIAFAARYGFQADPSVLNVTSGLITAIVGYVVGHIAVFIAPANK